MELALGVDIGGTKIRFAAVDPNGRILNCHVLPTEAQRGPEHVLRKVMAGIEALRSELSPLDEVDGIGIGSTGQIDFRSGEVVFAGDTMPGWTGTPIKREVERQFGIPVIVDNDVNVIAVAEKMFGAGRIYSSFVCLALGTGIGGAIVEAGELVRGRFGGAGELGHVSVDFNGPRCGCGNYGCIELYASGTGIARLGRLALASNLAEPAWEANSRAILQAWAEGEPAAGALMEQAIRALGTAIAGYIHTFNPEAIIIGGGVSESGDLFFNKLEQALNERTSAMMRQVCRLLPAYFRADAGVIGAAAQVWYYGGKKPAVDFIA